MPRSRSRRSGKRKRKSSTRTRGGGRRDEWIGGRLLPPFFVNDPEEEPFRPELVVWMDSQGLIVGHALPAPGETEGILARTLIEAMERPLIGPRRRPSALRVPDRSSAAEVRAAVGNRIPVRIAPTPELDEVLESMAESFPRATRRQGRSPKLPRERTHSARDGRGSLRVGGIPPPGLALVGGDRRSGASAGHPRV